MEQQFMITTDDKEVIKINEFTSKITFVTDLEFSRDGIFGFSIDIESNNLINITPSEEEDPYEARIAISTEHIQIGLVKLDRIMKLSDLDFSLTETDDDYDVRGKNQALFNLSDGVGSYYVDQYLEMENWSINLTFNRCFQSFQLQMSANGVYDKHIGFKVNTKIPLSNIHVLLRGSKIDTKESLIGFCKRYFPVNDLDMSFNEHEVVEGFKKEKKMTYDLIANFK